MFRHWNRYYEYPVIFILLTASLSTIHAVSQATGTKSEPPRVLLRVVNRHITVGKKISSDYLKVFSDGTIECQAIDEQGVNTLKKTQISPNELAAVISVLNNPQLSDLSRSYALNRFVVDSWMEWDITIDRPSLHPQRITLAFAGGSSEFKLPDALRRLGCQILDLRREVDGDEGAYFNPACTGF